MRSVTILRVVTLPQAAAASVPAFIGALMILLQDTSLVGAITVVELTFAAKLISQKTATSVEVFLVIGGVYLCLAWLSLQPDSYHSISCQRGGTLSCEDGFY